MMMMKMKMLVGLLELARFALLYKRINEKKRPFIVEFENHIIIILARASFFFFSL